MWIEHLQHLWILFQLLTTHHLFLKLSKCSFAEPQITYLGHVITSKGVQVDSSKIVATLDWPQPNTIRDLCGFLGLTSYYRKFVSNYGIIATPLTVMLKKNLFQCTDASLHAFDALKQAMTTTTMLVLPDFEQLFVIECDASDSGVGAVLQHNKPVAYFNQAMAVRHRRIPTYEKELISCVKAIKHWKCYLWGHKFLVCIDHYSLKFLLE